jgi:hypothetical protein
VALVFAREVSAPLTSLVKKLDGEVAKNKKAKLHAAVVMLSDDESLEKKLKDLGESNKNVSLGIDNVAGPKAWKVAKDADVTVILYTGRAIKVNQAFKKGGLKEGDVDKVVKDLSEIVK